MEPIHPAQPTEPIALQKSTIAAIDHDVAPHTAALGPGSLLKSVGELVELMLPDMVKVCKDFASQGVAPTAANVFAAAHKLNSSPADNTK